MKFSEVGVNSQQFCTAHKNSLCNNQKVREGPPLRYFVLNKMSVGACEGC